MKFLRARDAGDDKAVRKWRPVVKGMLVLAEEEGEGSEEPNGDLDGMSNAERKAAGRLAALRLFDCLWWDSPEPRDGEEEEDEEDEEYEEEEEEEEE
ncbi:MAG: hypothetical protein Q9190_007745 [Brigantiaea leucoxantha]